MYVSVHACGEAAWKRRGECAAVTLSPLAVTAASISSAAHSSSSCLRQVAGAVCPQRAVDVSDCEQEASPANVMAGSRLSGFGSGITHRSMGRWALRMAPRLASSSLLFAYTAQCACACRGERGVFEQGVGKLAASAHTWCRDL
jgi:hypothetical protein